MLILLLHCYPEAHLWLGSDSGLKRPSGWLTMDILIFLTKDGILSMASTLSRGQFFWKYNKSSLRMSCSSQNLSATMTYLSVIVVTVVSSRIVGKYLQIQQSNCQWSQFKRKLVSDSATNCCICWSAVHKLRERYCCWRVPPVNSTQLKGTVLFYVSEIVCYLSIISS